MISREEQITAAVRHCLDRFDPYHFMRFFISALGIAFLSQHKQFVRAVRRRFRYVTSGSTVVQ
jgi:hypothetical protein